MAFIHNIIINAQNYFITKVYYTNIGGLNLKKWLPVRV